MINPKETTLRAKKLGVLLRDARKVTCKSASECADMLGVTEQEYDAFELGEKSPSLPQLEILSFHLRIPVEHFWSDQLLLQDGDGAGKFNSELLVGLRQRMIGVLLRKMRKEKNLSLDGFARRTGIPTQLLEEYELGKRSIPFAELEGIAVALGFHIKDFMDRNGPVGSWFVQQRNVQDFAELSPKMREFVVKPVNLPFLELALKLSEMDVEKLRTVAETILEITL